MWLRASLVSLLGLAACGRLGFDPLAAGDGAAADTTVATGPIARFRFDDDPDRAVADGGAYQATCSAGTCPFRVPGRVGDAFKFDGVDDCLAISPALPPLQQLTVALWARQNDTGPMTFVSQPYFVNEPTGNSWEVEAGFNLDFTLTVLHGATAIETGSISGQVMLDAWYHVAFSWDGVRQRIFLAGTQIVDAPAPADPIPYDGTGWFLGCDNNMTAVQVMRGLLDDISVYDRALAANEIAALANP